MQDQEGFDASDKIELVQFNYRPFHVRSQIKRRPTQKVQESWQVTRDSNRGQWAHSVAMKEPQNIVFSTNQSQIVAPESQFIFDADFEGSNLELVIKRKFLEYELYMRPDTNTDSYYQWFNYKVKCLKGAKTATFTIKNFIKPGMLYNNGLKPFYRRGRQGNYHQLESEVKYFQNIPQDTYSLKFTFQFQKEGEEIQFCSQPPYTFTKLLSLISSKSLQSRTLCRSQLGKKIPYLTFNQQKSPKGIAIVIARQHPGQSVGSWMMHGLITKLCEQESSIQWVVVPMMCVDGVMLGNTRTGMPGYDFNRYWNMDQLSKKEKIFPEILGVINLVKQMKRLHPRKPKIFLDLHGHSSQPNIFTYGPPHDLNTQNYVLSRVFPQLLSRKNTNFNREQCSYMIKADKKNTVRNLMLTQYLIPFVYTIQASFGIMRDRNVNQNEYIQFGSDLVDVTEDFLLKYLIGEKNIETSAVLDSIKERGQQIEAIQYDSDVERQISEEKKTISVTDRGQKKRLVTQTPGHFQSKQFQSNHFQLFKVEANDGKRYMKPLERKRTHTQAGLAKVPKATFLPKLKQSCVQRKKPIREEQSDSRGSGALLNLRQIQKRLSKLKNTRVGKKILILNSYGV